MSLKINFFGASVTQQKNGFAYVFKNTNHDIECEIFGYGARHLNDAGICYILDAISNNPDFLVIDWFSTAFICEKNFEKIKIYIDTILYQTLTNNVFPIFIFLPQIGLYEDIYLKIKSYLDKFKVLYLDLSLEINDFKKFLRDQIHTNDHGSIEYTKILNIFFQTKVFQYKEIISIPEINKYCSIKKYSINQIVYNQISFEGNCEVIGISQVVGPHSGFVLIGNTLFNNWDRWCYYEREMINFNFFVENKKDIIVLQYDFDKSSCENQLDWPDKKYLKLKELFFCGEINYVYYY